MDDGFHRIVLALLGAVICLAAFTVFMRWHYATRRRQPRRPDDEESRGGFRR